MSNGIIPFADRGNKIAAYAGSNLLEIFGSAAALHSAISAGDFSRIHIGDYFPITVNGTFHDAADDTDKTLNETVKMEVASINPYIRGGDTGLTAPHVLMCSRDCMSVSLRMRSEGATWFDDTQSNPWRGSALWETLNNADNGIIKLLISTSLGPYIFAGPNNKGMRAMLPTMAAGAGSPTEWAWTDRGKLFLPTEREVYGAPVWGASGYESGNMFNQWPIFAGSARHIMKSAGDGGNRTSWWLENAITQSTFAYVSYTGFGSYVISQNTNSTPLCFLII